MAEVAEVLVKDVAEWIAWLEKNHSNEQGVWLILSKAGGTVTELTYDQALDEALCYGWIDGQIAKRDDQSFRRRFAPRRSTSRWSAKNAEHVLRLTNDGRMRAAGLKAVDAAKADGRWQLAYCGQATATTPTDLADALANNPDAASKFEQLDSANRYAIIYRLGTLRSTDARAQRIGKYGDMLARGDSIHPQKRRRDKQL